MELELPIGTTLAATERVTQQIERFIHTELKTTTDKKAGITHWVTYIGNGGPRFLLTHNPKPTSSNYALMIINVSSNTLLDNTMARLERFSHAKLSRLSGKVTKN